MRVLLVGELAYNPERIAALPPLGCELLGLWIDDPLPFMTVGPVPGVRDVRFEDVAAERPDVAYALLNWRMVPLALRVARAYPWLPIVLHYKEAPQRSLVRGEWELLEALLGAARTVIAISPEQAAYYEAVLPGTVARCEVMDGDLPPRSSFADPPFRRLSDEDGRVHVVCAGRPSGLDDAFRAELAQAGIVLHLHGAEGHPPAGIPELTRYDAGFLHRFRSANGGDLARAEWDDLNLPARIPTYLAAGLALLQNAQPGHAVATQSLIEREGIGILYRSARDIADRAAIERARAAVLERRGAHAFDAHAPRLVALLAEAAATQR